MPATHDATLHGVVFDVLVGRECRVGLAVGLPSRSSRAAPAFAQAGLHRIEPASVRAEVEAVGFVLDAESAMLANKDDPHSIKVFDTSIKGETDRFAYRFVKP